MTVVGGPGMARQARRSRSTAAAHVRVIPRDLHSAPAVPAYTFWQEASMRAMIFALLLCPVAVHAAPATYVLETQKSAVGFEADFGSNTITGKMPVTRADLTLDFTALSRSKIAVILDISGAQASFPFATQAMKGPKMLDADRHPEITFVSTSLTGTIDGAEVKGRLTLRGVTHPVVLHAVLYRQQGFAAGDTSHLTILLTGEVLRSAYGATGWADMVGDSVRLRILARIARVD